MDIGIEFITAHEYGRLKQLHASGNDIEIRLQITLGRSYVSPVAVRYKAHHYFAHLDELWKQPVFERKRLAFRNVVEQLRFEDVDPGVNRVASDFFGLWFFDEAQYPVRRIGHNESIAGRIRNG